MKKSHNPLKMWGSYLGGLIVGFFAYSIGSLCRIAGECIFYKQFILFLLAFALVSLLVLECICWFGG